jgi:hypothetical protein
VVIKNEYFPEATPKPSQRPVGLRRITDVQDIKSAPAKSHSKGKDSSREEAPNKLCNQPELSLSIYWNAVPVYLHPLKKFK